MYGDKSGVLLRCDNPDGNCALVCASDSYIVNFAHILLTGL